MTLQDALNRGYNLLGVGIVGLAGFAFLPEVFLENDIPDKIDDALLFLVGLYAMGWYVRGTNRFARSVQPVVFIVLALLCKILAAIIEFDDPEAVGDDMGGLILFVLATAFIIYQFRKTGQLLAERKPEEKKPQQQKLLPEKKSIQKLLADVKK